MELINELRRIYSFDEPRWDAENYEDFAAHEWAVWRTFSEELKALATFIGREESFPHPDVQMLYGPYELVEWNSEEGTFGQLREYDDYPYDKVIKFGDDTYLDVAGQLGEAGGVYGAIGHDLDCASLTSPSLLALLKSAGTYR
jgi:hypothetical protein